MGIFGGPHLVRILGPLSINGAVIACPQCRDNGTGHGHTISATAKDGLATITCRNGHQFTANGLQARTVTHMPRRGRFELRLGDTTIGGIAARPGKAKPDAGAKPSRTLTPKGGGAGGGGGRSSGGGRGGLGLTGLLAAGLGTATAGLNTVSTLGRAVSDTTKLLNNGVGVVRDGTSMLAKAQVAGYHEAADARAEAAAALQREHDKEIGAAERAERAAERKHEKAVLGAQTRNAAAQRTHEAGMQAAQAPASPQAARRRALDRTGGSASTRAALRRG
ncbi:hypothetical protein KV557_24710 [Kitasatospora aureofaciens]|uniref:hypothetical protein n=1 Tax=Kitasatospora aureofaciens TaxID=1894 RepID=UPI001C439362|nr:hypothetical protein [Kitasatospora aureofaciens]MBV6700267.1 hypothetical protein [Kitasatospora aureofaciens]